MGARGLKEHEDYFRAEDIGLSGHTIPANLDAYYPRPIFSEGGKNQEIQTRYLQDASYIRLKNFQLGYTFPAKWMKSMGLTKCRVFVSEKIFGPEHHCLLCLIRKQLVAVMVVMLIRYQAPGLLA